MNFIQFLLPVTLATALCMPLSAQPSWPDKPVRIVVPYAAGGTTDFAARQVAQKLTEQTGKSFFVENKTGASGTIGSNFVAKSAPDGNTLLTNDTTYAMLPSIFKKLPWDHASDLIPVTTLAITPVVLVVPAQSPFKTVAELIAFAKAHPGQLNFGSGGAGSSSHLSGEVFKKEARVFMTHIPYKGAGDAMLALMGNQVDVLITASPTAIPVAKGGKVRALATTGDKRLSSLGAVPTFKEAGLPGFSVMNWFGLAAPKGTPAEIVQKLQQEVAKAMMDPGLLERFSQQGAQPGGLPNAEFAALVKKEISTWSSIAQAAGVKPE
ncbi:tripartite tricarboxylate transporter substrate binding protein [Curvibacter sp. RS43]|uniref:Bug family tripartite tricarboxylate transporter substrate binding protein n=1 Tax=Curvibacter microcysteis TaxID=3026419 RepID=UPI002361EFD3|nr:tripartite tricarboxylate transporter substrate binding protein [Curvibacter sp. RS43]MDD0812850.1 tripartite tricarboxylate transporter substrate binding protein [Curvibacter sp. RS43]